MTEKEMHKQYKEWVNPHHAREYRDPITGDRLPFYPFKAWTIERSNERFWEWLQLHRGHRADIYREYRIWCVENTYDYECPERWGIESII